MRGKQIVLAIVLLFATCSVTWAGKEAYKIVMSKEKEVCAAMLKIFNADRRKHGTVMFEEHKEFIQWEPVEVKPEPPVKYCRQLLQANFDINNDGTDDLVIRTRHCFKGLLMDSLYVYPLESPVPEVLEAPQIQPLGALDFRLYILRKGPMNQKGEPKAWIGWGALVLEAFKKGEKSYIILSDYRQEWIAIAQYLDENNLDDMCYFHKKGLPAN